MVRSPLELARREARGTSERLVRTRLVCRGTVQGVGFRPAVHRLAVELGLAGFVANDSDGATIELEGRSDVVRTFVARLAPELATAARLARLAELVELPLEPTGETEFVVASSHAGARRRALVPPDAKLCDACRAELDDPRDRRSRYAFTTCTHCGPRFTVTRALPYDRERTSLEPFPLCARCAAEYTDPRDRRFHAETVCCPDCGPTLAFENVHGERLATHEHALALARNALALGDIVAVQGLGGFQLAVRADAADTLRRLRAAKRRPTRPFAVMVRDLEVARSLVHLAATDERLLDSPAAPILLAPIRLAPTRTLEPESTLAPVIAPCRDDARGAFELAPEVAPGVDDLGLFLPTTPLHVELFRGAPYAALVVTSGNLHDEPICRTHEEARAKLAGLADFLLVHDREIVRRADDSVVRTRHDGHALVRRSRGYVPEPLALAPAAREPVLALGGHLQNTVALAVDHECFPSQHVGDLDTEAARAFQLEVARGLEDFLQVEARVFAVDAHPDYPSTWLGERLAAERGGRVLRVQHHLAHAAATLCEHGLWPAADERVGAWILDGTGYGPAASGDDARAVAWGAEALELDGRLRWRRAATTEPLVLVGGERAVHEPWRVAVAALANARLAEDHANENANEYANEYAKRRGDAFGDELDRVLARLPLAARIAPERQRAIAALARRSTDFPRAHGAGRIFEAAGALLGLAPVNTYEGEAAARFEALAARATSSAACEPWPEVALAPDARRLPTHALFAALARRVLAHAAPEDVARGFHATFAGLAAELARRVFARDVRVLVLGGGAFVNRLLALEFATRCAPHFERVLLPRALPAGDGGLACGQAQVAAAALAHACLPERIGV
ncbi:MAG: Sua5/YciO/YrdC/YwlC family protein [Planctomycetes bacterium]|nr:Sua5/YciO/YrdC/YwlC family protein [Planctomycetota bacterium]